MTAALEVQDLSVHFSGVLALDSISLTVARDTIHGVIGPNGSGKTTLFNALCGFVPCSGLSTLFGRPLLRLPPHKRAALGLARTFQNPKLGEDLTVRDLLRAGEHQRRVRPFWKETFTPWLAQADAKETDRRAAILLQELGIILPSLDLEARQLAHGTQKMIDLARSMMGQPKLILLDEPTSGLNESEIAALRKQIQRLRLGGLTIVLVEHNVRFLRDICDRVTVLDAGRRIADGSIDDVVGRPEVITAYMGEETSLLGSEAL